MACRYSKERIDKERSEVCLANAPTDPDDLCEKSSDMVIVDFLKFRSKTMCLRRVPMLCARCGDRLGGAKPIREL